MKAGPYPFFGAPHARQPRPVDQEPAIRGKRVILSTPEGFVYDMRAATAVYLDACGRPVVDIVTEEDYYRWMILRVAPVDRVPYSTRLVWVE